MKYIRPEIDIIELEADVVRTSGDYTENETVLEEDKTITAPSF